MRIYLYAILVWIFLFTGNLNLFAQTTGGCNSNTSICTAGVAGPFDFDDLASGPPVDYADPVGCPTGTGGNPTGFGFILLYITQSGPLNLLVDGDATTGYIDVIVYDIPSGTDPCVAVLDDNNEIGCNYAPSASGCTQFGSDFPCPSSVAAPNVTAGQVIMVIAHDYSDESTTYTLELGPTGAQTGPPDATIDPAGPFCDTDGTTQLTAANMGGIWSGPGTTADGIFDPAIAGAGTHTIDYTIGQSPCDDQDQTTITVNNCSCVQIDSINTIDPDCAGGNNGSIEVFASAGTTPYQYSIDGGGSYQGGNSFTGLFSGTYDVQVEDASGCISAISTVTITDPPALTVTIATTDETTTGACDGTASSSPTGGTTPYSYQWSNGSSASSVSALCPGSHSITVTDANGCTVVNNFIIYPSWCVSNVDFNTWIQEGDPVDGDWIVCCGGSEVEQSINGNPTFYVSPDTFINVVIQGVIEVTTTSDDDMIGFVFGYKDPTGTPYDNYDTWLFDWKKLAQTAGGFVAEEGMALSHIQGTIPNADIWEYFWGHTNNPPLFDVAGTNFGAGTGWIDQTAYQFTLVYTTTRTVIMIDSDTIFDITGCFEPGRFGFYNFSQSQVKYSAFQYQLMNDFQVLTPEVCAGDTAQFMFIDTAACTGIPSNMGSWTWDFGDGNSSTDLNPVHVYDTSGVYPVTLLVTDYLGCQDIVNKTITVNMTQTDLASTPVSCYNGTDGTASATVSEGIPPFIYQWCNGQTDSTATGLSAGICAVTVTDDNNCSVTQNVTLTQPPALAATDSSTDVICNGQSNGTATINVNGGTPPYSYLWVNSQTSVTATGLAAGNYPVTSTDANGCTLVSNVTVSEPAMIDVISLYTSDYNGVSVSCYGASDGFVDLAVSGGISPYSYLWSNGATTQNINGLGADSYDVLVTDDNGCTATDSLIISEPLLLTVVINDVTDVTCNGGSDGGMTLDISGGTAPYFFNWSNGLNTSNISNVAEGNYEVTVTDANSCTAVTGAVVNEPSELLITVSDDTTICTGTTTRIEVDTTIGGVGPPYFFTWSNGYGNYRGQDVGAGTYTVIVTDNNGCSATGTIKVNNFLPLSLNALADNDSLCEGDTVGLLAAFTGGTGNYDIEWFSKDYLSDPYIAQPVANPENTITYTVVVKDQVCDTPNDTAMVSIMVNPVPELIFGWDTTQGCTPLQVEFTNNSTHMNSASWDFGNGTVVNDISPAIVHSYGNYGVYDVGLKVTSSSGCEKDTVLKNLITAHPDPIADFTMSPQPTTVMESEIMFTDMSSIPRGIINQWDWEFSGLGISNDRNPIFQYPSDTGTYPVMLTVTSGYGCKDETLRHVRIGADFAFYIPNAFSPNGDGRNELFKPRAVGVIQDDYVLFIFDRWGELVYQTSKFNEGWDGTDKNGGPAPQGVYVYRIIAKDYTDNPSEEKGHSYMGHVTLLR